MCMSGRHDAHVETEDNSQESILPFYRVGPRERTQGIRLGSKCITLWAIIILGNFIYTALKMLFKGYLRKYQHADNTEIKK